MPTSRSVAGPMYPPNILLGERETLPRCRALLSAFYAKQGMARAPVAEKIAFLKSRLGYAFYATFAGTPSKRDELGALERALLAEPL